MSPNRHLVWQVPMLAAAVFGMMVVPAFAAVIVTNDEWFSFGKKYWGDKNHNNSYTGTLGKNYYCRNNDGSTKTDCPTLIDSRTNYVRHTTKLSADSGTFAWGASLQGEDPWGHSDTDGGAANHNNKFPRVAVDDYKLSTQYTWVDDTIYSDSKPSSTATNGVIKGLLLTNLWWADVVSTKTSSNNYKNVLVIDFAFANLKNENGKWVRDAKTIGGQYTTPFVDRNPNDLQQCIYHYNVVVDSNQVQNQWREVSRNIKTDIQNAFGATYTDLASGQCSTTVPRPSSDFRLVDQETGVEIYIEGSPSSSKFGTLVGAYSRSNLEDTS